MRFALFVAFVLAVSIGSVVRIEGISTKTFFSDESFSVLRITGHTEAAFRKLVDDRVRPLSAVAAFQRPDAHTSVAATLASIGSEEPQRGPLYYALATLWLNVGGLSISGLRSLAAIVGILGIGSAFVFGRVFFRSNRGGAILAAFFALSPFQIPYGEQTREYGLLALIIFLSGASLTVALRDMRGRSWLAFGMAAAIGMFTSPFFSLVIASYVIYVLYVRFRGRGTQRLLTPFVASVAGSIVVVSPWYVYAARSATNVSTETSWGLSTYPAPYYIAKFIFNIGAVFYDYEFANIGYAIALIAVFPAIAYLIVRGFRIVPNVAAFTIALALPTILTLVINDLRSGAHFATIARYGMPAWIALEIAVAAGAVEGIATLGRRGVFLRAGATAVLLAASGFCAIADGRYTMWWDNNDNEPTKEIAIALDSRPHPILIASKLPLTLALVHYLNDSVRIQLYSDDRTPSLSRTGDPNMLLLPTPQIRSAIGARRGEAGMKEVVQVGGGSVVRQFHTSLQRAKHDESEFIDPSNALWALPRTEGL